MLTKKGKGYEPAESNPSYFHGVGCFEPETGKALKFGGCALPSYTEVFGRTLCELAETEPGMVAITAAMPEGTGLARFAEAYPERFVDVGICEQHRITSYNVCYTKLLRVMATMPGSVSANSHRVRPKTSV